ncbi:retrovirus-related Pol polyprotein from transposon 297 [Trichonephila clavipes]|nr:retrovirus-related Pol polyprotein from transposon 297 [Trichonephila clavipes]
MRLEELERAEKMRLEELERAEKIKLEELVKEQALKEKELQLKFDLESRKILNAVQTRSQVKAAREERGIDSGDAKKGEDEVIIVSSDAEDEILIPALQEYVPELALLRVTRENLINAKKNSEIKSLYEQAASQVQVTNQVYSLEKELLVKNREDKLDAGSEWDKHLPSILLALRTVSHEKYRVYTVRVGVWENLRTPETLVMEHWMEPEEEVEVAGKEPRPCIDYRKLNGIIRTEYFPLPNIEERVEKVSVAKFITVLDLSKGYWQIPLSKTAQRYAAFCTSFGTYRPLRMSFGLKNAPYLLVNSWPNYLTD